MMGLILKLVIGVAILPIAAGVTVAFYNNLILIKELAGSLKYFLWGAGGYVILHLLFYKPTYLYVLGHEAVHAGVAWMFGGRIKSFKVSEQGGSVKTDKTNTIIELSPYFIPIYTLLVAVIYFIIASSYNINGAIFVFLIGFTLAFHVVSTIEVMKIRQPDIVKSGSFFSIIFVYVLNIIIIAVLFSFIFPSFLAKRFFIDIWEFSRHIYYAVFKQLFL